jgi:ankyrin repeat protein
MLPIVAQRGWSPLHIACYKGNAVMADLLLRVAKDQKNFCGSGKNKVNSDCERMINAKEKSRVSY